jgi:hypothetical protein
MWHGFGGGATERVHFFARPEIFARAKSNQAAPADAA